MALFGGEERDGGGDDEERREALRNGVHGTPLQGWATSLRACPADQACPADTFSSAAIVCNTGTSSTDASRDAVCDPDEHCPGAANGAWWRLKQRFVPGALRRVDAAEPVATGAAMLAAHRVAGLTTSLPLRSADSAASAGDPALLDAFVRAATLHDKEHA